MTKEKERQKDKRPRGTSSSRSARDWQPLFARLQEATDWGLDIAKHLAGDIDEDVEAIERTRGYLHSWLEGRRVDIDMNDVLTTLAVLFAAIEIDLGIDSSPMLHGLALAGRMLHLPGAARDELPTVVIRTPMRRRNAASSVFTQLAA
ncbi:MAG TPA: hypothetical protein VGG74_01520 [Kofleriaceae bacterium]